MEPTRQQGSPSILPIFQFQGETSRHGEQQGNSPHSSSDSDPIIASLRNKNTRRLREIYSQDYEVDMQVHFALFSCEPIHFEEAIKEEKWIHTMN